MKIIRSRTTYVLLSNFRKCTYVVFVLLSPFIQAQLNANRIAPHLLENGDPAFDKSEKGHAELYISDGTVVFDPDNTISAKLIPIHPKKNKKNDRKVAVAKVDKKVRDNSKKVQSNPKSPFTIVSSDDGSIISTSLLSPTNVVLSTSNFQLKAISAVEKVWKLLKYEEFVVCNVCYECEFFLKKYIKTYSIRPPPKYTRNI